MAFALQPLDSTLVAALAWSLMCLFTVVVVSYGSAGVLYVLALSLMPVAIYAFVRLLFWEKRWRSALLLVAGGLPLAILCCVVQIKSCPHCPWLQVMGASIPPGQPCGNPQVWRAWWSV